MRKLLLLFVIAITFFGCCNDDCFGQPHPDVYLQVGEDCSLVLPDFRGDFDYLDNCAVKDTVQLPAPGTTVSIITSPIVSIEIIARDVSDNIASTTFNVILVDTVPPTIVPKAVVVGVFEEYQQVGGNKLRATPIIMRGTGMIRELASYHKGYEDGKMIMALYSDKDGKPNKLMVTTGEVQMKNVQGWQVEPVLEPIRLIEGQPLWLAFITDQAMNNEGIMASPIDEYSDVAASYGMYTGSMPLEFGESTQYKWEHSINMRYVQEYDKPVTVLAEEYLEVERYINGQIEGYVTEFDWSTASIDTVFAMPKCIPVGSIVE